MKNIKQFDFLTSIILMAASIYVIVSGFGIYKKAGEPMYVSPGLLPIILGFAMILCCIFLMISSLKGSSIKSRINELKEWFSANYKEHTIISMIVGTIIMGIYTFVLLSIFPFWLASIIFIAFLMIYLNAASLVKILLTSIGAVGGIILIFQIIFRIPLP
ncbi:tripartite tricarboxylate transporter TctB family protein [Lachnoclostridium phytofermentans]|uniref:DUF1468 domain-containing protein n=1 Tax=Lachnoclostridium phytofermentans (strain ATCC 700394 / DSM 18823 / ISDg) TaxID=357809 RepID=A9KIY5_LACP7|nr:tripartite tricarboxylate transporter TctB family protein [Lachnoclostridium phytofermentans]ABX40984.1 hypothetical protein Cphy_0597 [Lachnoclostridium phytofermentans ISDg]